MKIIQITIALAISSVFFNCKKDAIAPVNNITNNYTNESKGSIRGAIQPFNDDGQYSTILGGFKINVDKFNISATTYDNGRYILQDVPEGYHAITVSKQGFYDAKSTIKVEKGTIPIYNNIIVSIFPPLTKKIDSLRIDAIQERPFFGEKGFIYIIDGTLGGENLVSFFSDSPDVSSSNYKYAQSYDIIFNQENTPLGKHTITTGIKWENLNKKFTVGQTIYAKVYLIHYYQYVENDYFSQDLFTNIITYKNLGTNPKSISFVL